MKKEDTMDKNDRPTLGKQARWAAGALGVVLAYLGAFAVLMFPVIEAASKVA